MKFRSKSLISIILSIMMVISMILVAIPANAAVIDSVSVGAGPYYLWYIKGTQMPTTTYATLESVGGTNYSCDFTNSNANQWYTFLINKSTSDPKDSSTVWTRDNKPTIVYDDTFTNKYFWDIQSSEQDGYGIIKLNFKSACTVKFTFNEDESEKTFTISEAGSTPTSYAVNFGSGTGGTGTGEVTAKKSDSIPISNGGMVESGTSVTFTANANSGSTFAGWFSDINCTTEILGADKANSTYTTEITGNTNVYAKFNSVPSLTSVTLSANKSEVAVNESFTLTAKVEPSTATDVKYTFYQGTRVLVSESKSNTYTVTPSAAGTYNYKVVATLGSKEVTSDVIPVTVKPLSITGVTLKSSNSTVKPEETFTLTATATPGGLSDVTYTFYQSDDLTVSTDTDTSLESNGNTATVTASKTTGSYYYYVVAKDANDVEKTSSIVTVKVTNEGAVINSVKIRFKGTTLSSLIPYMSVDGGAAEVMTRSTANPIGTHLSGAYRFVWFEATIPTVTVGQSKTLTFTTKMSNESTMKASITLDFTTLGADNVIYIAVDNLMSGTTAVDITNNETARTSFGSAMNMIKQSSASDPVATTLLSTMLKVTSASGQVTTKRYYLGDLDSDKIIGIKDATEIQKSIAGSSDLGAEYQSLGDFNADGVVDIKDATAIQKYIAGF